MEIKLSHDERDRLESLARLEGEAPEEIARRLVSSALRRGLEASSTANQGSSRRLREEGGIWVLRTGEPVIAEMTDEMLREVRAERSSPPSP